jgi:hypothetical protein
MKYITTTKGPPSTRCAKISDRFCYSFKNLRMKRGLWARSRIKIQQALYRLISFQLMQRLDQKWAPAIFVIIIKKESIQINQILI